MKSIGKHNGVWHWFQRCGQMIFCISLSLSQHLIRFTGNHKSSNLWTYTMTPQKHRTHTLVKQVTSSKFLISFNFHVQLFVVIKQDTILKWWVGYIVMFVFLHSFNVSFLSASLIQYNGQRMTMPVSVMSNMRYIHS